MIRCHQRHINEARQLLSKAKARIAENKPKNQDLIRLAAEAEESIDSIEHEAPRHMKNT
jgi:sRNA-binding protein